MTIYQFLFGEAGITDAFSSFKGMKITLYVQTVSISIKNYNIIIMIIENIYI